MNRLNKTKCYLASPLENTNNLDWRSIITKEFNKLGIVCLDPTIPVFENQVYESAEDREMLKEKRAIGDFKFLHEYMVQVIRKDLREIDIADFIIVNLEPSKPTYGTIHEIVVSSQQRKPIICIVPDRKSMPLWLIGLLNMDFVFESIEEVVNYINAVDSGAVEIDSKYWKLLLPEFR